MKVRDESSRSNLHYAVTPEDLFEPSQPSGITSGLLSSASAGSDSLPLNFGQLNVLVAFQSDAGNDRILPFQATRLKRLQNSERS